MWAKGQVRGAVCEWNWGSRRDMGKIEGAERERVQQLGTGRGRVRDESEFWRGTQAEGGKVPAWNSLADR